MRELSLLTDPGFADNRLYIARPLEAGPYQLLGPYGERATPARWVILTDGIGVDRQFRTVINNLGGRTDGDWRIRNTFVNGQVVVERDNRRTSLQLTQDTFEDAAYGCGEVDLFVMAIALVPGLITEPGIIPFSDQPSLAEMTNLTFTWRERLVSRTIGRRCAPLLDAALTMGSVYFKNTTTDQTFQYQVVTSDARFLLFEGSYFANLPGGEFVGVADNSATVYGLPYLQRANRKRTVQIDILPRVLTLLAAIPNVNVDKDPRHWYTLMTANGSYTNGKAKIVSTWSDINLVAVVS